MNIQVLIFTQDNCQFCRQYEPAVDAVKLANPSIDFPLRDNTHADNAKYGISRYPTTVIVDNAGRELFQSVGVLSQGELEQAINQAILDTEGQTPPPNNDNTSSSKGGAIALFLLGLFLISRR